LNTWIKKSNIITLNVAGPRASKDHKIYQVTRDILEAAFIKEDLMIPKKGKKESQAASILGSPASAQDLLPIELLRPTLDSGKSVLKALQQRKTIREISDKKLSLQVLSNLLWAACGVNRKKVPIGIFGRTAASASNSQEIDVYVAMPEGIYLYDAFHHRLLPVVAGDLRALALGQGQPNFGAKAPARLIYIVDINKLSNTSGYQEPGLQDPENEPPRSKLRGISRLVAALQTKQASGNMTRRDSKIILLC
jgi:hypothetical protein